MGKNILPVIKRTRGYLLYDIKGKRYLDFYQDGGRAILGHRMDGISGVVKSTVARGLTPAYPSIYTYRIEKQLKLLFPFVSEFRIYGNMERALAAVSKNEGKLIKQNNLVDFPVKSEEYAYWRPFLGNDLNWQEFKYFIPILPFPGNFGPIVVASNTITTNLSLSDPLSPLLCDMLIKSISLIRAVKKRDCKDRSGFESPVWERIGPYLRFKLSATDYSILYKKALDCLVLLPPTPLIPGIIPCNYENGQIKGFMDMLRLVERGLYGS
ncbi:MAG: glutamate-1-semialdehyde aminotransferase [Spirochaetes bacterium]|nr:MAG: glutamate-1-semialdehyde aminotransferase [Spirochaetota bacterium]